jgi:hypothetical protein
MYDLINLQIDEYASGTRSPVFEVVEITDAHLLLIDLCLPARLSISLNPRYVAELLDRLGIREGRRVFYNGESDLLYEIIFENKKFRRIRQRSDNKSLSARMAELLQDARDKRHKSVI